MFLQDKLMYNVVITYFMTSWHMLVNSHLTVTRLFANYQQCIGHELAMCWLCFGQLLPDYWSSIRQQTTDMCKLVMMYTITIYSTVLMGFLLFFLDRLLYLRLINFLKMTTRKYQYLWVFVLFFFFIWVLNHFFHSCILEEEWFSRRLSTNLAASTPLSCNHISVNNLSLTQFVFIRYLGQ